MDKVIWKAYSHFEKEEKWLNEMSAKGFALVSYTWCRYVFQPCQPGEYIYRIELLPAKSASLDSLEYQEYIDFLEETGAEPVTSHGRWIYFRRKATEGPFDIYSDADSRISHYKRILYSRGIVGLCNLIVWFLTFSFTLNNYKQHGITFNVVVNCLNFMMGVVLTGLFITYLIKIQRLKKEKRLRE